MQTLPHDLEHTDTAIAARDEAEATIIGLPNDLVTEATGRWR
jgi:hypothetical protein